MQLITHSEKLLEEIESRALNLLKTITIMADLIRLYAVTSVKNDT